MKRYKDIQGYRGRYRIYEDGRIWSAWGKKFKKRRISKDGYVVTVLWNKRAKSVKCKWFSIHRLLYLYFIGKIPKGKQINHKNGIKTDNRLENLEIVTPLENTRHAWRIGLSKRLHGEETSLAKLNDSNIRQIRALKNTGKTQKEIAKVFDVDQTNIHYILSGKTWSHVK